MVLLSIMFITYIPNMANAGKETGTIRTAFSDVLKLIFGGLKIRSLFILYPMIANAMNVTLNEIKRGAVDNGVSYPRLSDELFTNNPKNIKNDMLSPTDNTNFSVNSILFSFKICRINNPGKIIRKINPRICLNIGMFKRIAMSVMKSIGSMNANHPPTLNLFIIFKNFRQNPNLPAEQTND